jgi:hypothetical protein
MPRRATRRRTSRSHAPDFEVVRSRDPEAFFAERTAADVVLVAVVGYQLVGGSSWGVLVVGVCIAAFACWAMRTSEGSSA